MSVLGWLLAPNGLRERFATSLARRLTSSARKKAEAAAAPAAEQQQQQQQQVLHPPGVSPTPQQRQRPGGSGGPDGSVTPPSSSHAAAISSAWTPRQPRRQHGDPAAGRPRQQHHHRHQHHQRPQHARQLPAEDEKLPPDVLAVKSAIYDAASLAQLSYIVSQLRAGALAPPSPQQDPAAAASHPHPALVAAAWRRAGQICAPNAAGPAAAAAAAGAAASAQMGAAPPALLADLRALLPPALPRMGAGLVDHVFDSQIRLHGAARGAPFAYSRSPLPDLLADRGPGSAWATGLLLKSR
jgi:hypothetical protein